jgi:hypothetical protein
MTPWELFSSTRKMWIGSAETLPRLSWNEPSVESQPRWTYLEQTPSTDTLSSNLLTLGRDLRDAGMNIGSGQIINLVEAVSEIDCPRRFLFGGKDDAGYLAGTDPGFRPGFLALLAPADEARCGDR